MGLSITVSRSSNGISNGPASVIVNADGSITFTPGTAAVGGVGGTIGKVIIATRGVRWRNNTDTATIFDLDNTGSVTFVGPVTSTNGFVGALAAITNGGGTVAVTAAGLVTITPADQTGVVAQKLGLDVIGNTVTITGNFAQQRNVVIERPTVTSVGAQTITRLVNVQIAGPTILGGAAVATTNLVLEVLLGSSFFSGPVQAYLGGGSTNQGLRTLNLDSAATSSATNIGFYVAGAATLFGHISVNSNGSLFLDGQGTGGVVIGQGSGTGGVQILNGAGVLGALIASTGKMAYYSRVITTAWGVPAIYGYLRPAQQVNTTVTLATYTVLAADGSFLISANVNVTASATAAMTVTVSYTDETNTPVVDTLPFILLNATVVGSITTAQGNIAYASLPIRIRCKAATTITVATAGTVTGITYTAEADITQVA